MRTILAFLTALLGIGFASAQGPIVSYLLRDDIIFSEYTGNCSGTDDLLVDIYYEEIEKIVYSGICIEDDQFGDICQFLKDTTPAIKVFALHPGLEYYHVIVWHAFSQDPIIACADGCPAAGTERTPIDVLVVPQTRSCFQ